MSQSTRVPRRLDQFVPWLISRVDLWNGGQAGPPDIGLSAQQLADLTALRDDFVQKYNDAKAARDSSKAKTVLQHEAYEALRSVLGGDIDIIDGYAKATGDMGVYARAQLDPPKDPTPRETAPVPEGLEIRASSFGDLVLTFEANKGQGSVFIIQRQLRAIGQEPGVWTYADTVSEKTWTDTSVPNGVASVRYRVRTKLTNGVLSDWSEDKGFFYGTGGSGATSAAGVTIEDAQALKDAQTAKGAEKAG
ncbi:MAG: hypothetical protein RIE32_13355 [Phycisphaerales bacterium]